MVRLAVMTAAGILFLQAAASGQVLTTGQTAQENASSGAVRERAPGNLVRAGVARAIEFGAAAGAGIEITETAPATSIWAQAAAQTIASLFEQLNQAIQAIHALLLARAGKSPTVPTPTPGGGGSAFDNLLDNFGGRR